MESSTDGGFDLQITGNAHSSSSEPGIIWVSQDENGNGLPDDTWYELRGSEYGKPETWQDYAVTYYRPSSNGTSIEWTDNRGSSGTVDYIPAYHSQETYFPLWITADRYTLRGTRLEDRLEDQNGNGSLWIGHPFDWGYADNWSETDPDIDKFSISDAVRWDGEPAGLKYIDFVKIQCGVQAKGGWTGEQSTGAVHRTHPHPRPAPVGLLKLIFYICSITCNIIYCIWRIVGKLLCTNRMRP